MTVNSVEYDTSVQALLANQTTTASEASEADEDPMGREAFLTMLVAQLENQDPLNPADGTDFTAQLAQFSSLEQMFNMNDSLKAILEGMNAGSSDNLIDYIGKQVTCASDALRVSDGTASGGYFSITDSADVTICIYDESGQEIRRIYAGKLEAGSYDINWDGTDYAGIPVDDGTYSYEVVAGSDSGGYVPVYTTMTGIVNGVSYDSDTPYLLVEDRKIDPQTVTDVRAVAADSDVNES